MSERCELCGAQLHVRQEWRHIERADGKTYAKRVRVKPLQAVISFHLEGQWPRSEMERALDRRPVSPREPIRFCQPCFVAANSRFLEMLSVAVVRRLERGER